MPDALMHLMHLKILLPSGVLLDLDGVTRIVAEEAQGSFGLLPRRLDCVAALAPGILCYESAAAGECFVAVDAGVLIKTGAQVRVSVRAAIPGTDLAQLRLAVLQQFEALDAAERGARAALARLEAGFLRHMRGIGHG
ncbi:F0F1 ATP synthase subunit epsilon [Janthinobacterium sp.]|uniref:F0F1 ATP synthase subunit epsilon n=1 Tax=Janthinobacterium sp. TaxID=1871054 RepID=UPI00293D91E8|nr:F0F1 ATP synthase subunit epsilon [Janthinobacterium sp.]